MRVTSDFFVSSFVRRIFGAGGFAAVSKRGAAEAGAIFIVVDRMDKTFDFYGPAPQAMFMEQPQGRLFELQAEGVDALAIAERLDRETKMDPDFWVVEVEAEGGTVDLPLAEEEPEPNPADRFFKL